MAAGLVAVLSSARAEASEPPRTLTELLDDPSLAPVGEAREVDAAPAELRVDVAPGIDDAALLPGWIADRHPGLAKAVRDPEGAHAQWIAVEIVGATYDYRVTVTAMRDGEPLGAAAEPTRCECTTEELLALVDVGIDAAVERLRARPASAAGLRDEAEAAPAPSALVPRVEPAGSSASPTALDAPRRRLGTLGYTGIGVGVAGVGLAIAGVSLALRPDAIVGEPGSLERVSSRRVGIGLAASGGVVLGAGLSLLAVDLVRRRDRTLALQPSLGPQRVGLSLLRRF